MDESLRAVYHALAYRQKISYNLVLVYDAGPNVQLLEVLQQLQARFEFTLVVNEENLGFVATCNKGMRVNPHNDVVLLNADAYVYNGWLDNLADVAYREDDIVRSRL